MLGTTFAENYVKKMIQAVELSFDVMTVGGMSGRMLVAAEDPCPFCPTCSLSAWRGYLSKWGCVCKLQVRLPNFVLAFSCDL